jgi:hypothetical protein
MRAQVTKLATVSTVAVWLMISGIATAMAEPSFDPPGWTTGMDGVADGPGNARASVVRLDTDENGEQRAGYMVGQRFVGILPVAK